LFILANDFFYARVPRKLLKGGCLMKSFKHVSGHREPQVFISSIETFNRFQSISIPPLLPPLRPNSPLGMCSDRWRCVVLQVASDPVKMRSARGIGRKRVRSTGLHGMQEVRGSSPLSSTHQPRFDKPLETSTSEAISICFCNSSPIPAFGYDRFARQRLGSGCKRPAVQLATSLATLEVEITSHDQERYSCRFYSGTRHQIRLSINNKTAESALAHEMQAVFPARHAFGMWRLARSTPCVFNSHVGFALGGTFLGLTSSLDSRMDDLTAKAARPVCREPRRISRLPVPRILVSSR
jgi:hypothetical protein